MDAIYTPECHNILLYPLYDEPFLVMVPFMLKVKYTSMHAAYTQEAQIFVNFALWGSAFELRTDFQKSASNDPK